MLTAAVATWTPCQNLSHTVHQFLQSHVSSCGSSSFPIASIWSPRNWKHLEEWHLARRAAISSSAQLLQTNSFHLKKLSLIRLLSGSFCVSIREVQRGVAAMRRYSGIHRFTCSPHGMYVTKSGVVEAGGEGGETLGIQALIRKIRSMKGSEWSRPSAYVCVPLQQHKEAATMSAEEEGGINNLIHYLLCKAHQHCYTMATIELLIAFLSYPPGENAHAPAERKTGRGRV